MKPFRAAAMIAAATAVTASVWLVTAPSPDEVSIGTSGRGVARNPPLVSPPVEDIAGVCVLAPLGNEPVSGALLFRPAGADIEISGTVEGLPPGRYHFQIAEFGDTRNVTSGSVGEFFLSENALARLPEAGMTLDELTSFDVGASRIAKVHAVSPILTLYGPNTLIGRAFVIYDEATAASDARRVAFGVIGRANLSWTPRAGSPMVGHDERVTDRC